MSDGQSPHWLLGRRGEQTAAAILANKGYSVLARNWRAGHLELDLVCEKNGEIIFVEVKTRSRNSRGGGPGAITAGKRTRLLKAAQLWLQQAGRWNSPCHFDILCLYGAEDNFRMEHFQNAIEFPPSLGCGHSHWQPW